MWMQINFRRSEVIDASCTCAAGKGLCHHTVAVLYQLQHYQKLGLKVVPPLASKTSMPQVKKILKCHCKQLWSWGWSIIWSPWNKVPCARVNKWLQIPYSVPWGIAAFKEVTRVLLSNYYATWTHRKSMVWLVCQGRCWLSLCEDIFWWTLLLCYEGEARYFLF